MINNHQLITETSSTTPWNDLLLEIAQTPEEYIPEILEIVRLFRQNLINKPTTLITTEKHKLEWQEFINQTAGSCADDPIILDNLGIDDTLDDSLEEMINC
ncbi:MULTISPECIES: hypothetical protein [unclassified Anabaena]|jgi:hypothetical protein|uniref:hypothetical protein n=1 Tax=unclassified Anabaena TaxID=2619674 RepID=UPI0006AC83B2|nr:MULTISPECIES: hypothetical protein [unclassified Anabaena]ALB40590.1 hypothetical protein AA650_09015 [Anabaena sp. WA102]OBQ16459.1 MAG: hypothetical protein AN486_18930 [Anabaena sp. AL93]